MIVCEQHGADWLPFKDHLVTRSSNMPGQTGVSIEVIWYREGKRGKHQANLF